MKLQLYALNEFAPKLVAASPQRSWMDDFPDRHAYRCLPLSIANAHGWSVLCPAPIEVEWNGGPNVADLSVRQLKPLPGNRPLDHFVRSNFSRGIVTFHLDYLIRTEPGWDLMATGPLNRFKDNAAPLTGIMESDWLPYPFTMNWQILRPGRVVFEEDEPFCFFFPIKKQALLDCEPEIHRLSDDPELQRQHEAFRVSREEFMKKFHAGDPATLKQPWLRYYFLGKHPDGTQMENHVNKLRLKEPVDRRTPRSPPTVAAASPRADRVAGSVGVGVGVGSSVNARPAGGGSGAAATTSIPVRVTVVPKRATSVEAKPALRTDPRWEDGSPLNSIPSDQSKLNEQGRKRIDRDGRLLDSSHTRFVHSAADAVGLDILVVDDLLSADECDLLCRTFHELSERVFKDETIDPFWNNRFVWFADIMGLRSTAGALMAEKQRRALELITRFYRLKAPIYADLLQIVCWKPGMFMPPHADNANPDGSKHGMAHRELSGVIYLNDDYNGGELYFTALDLAIKPKRGMLVSMSGGFHHEHGVLRVDGTRFTMPSFYTFDRSKADKLLLDQVMA